MPPRLAEVLDIAEGLMAKEEQMKADLIAGMDVLEVDRTYNYENMLKSEKGSNKWTKRSEG